jgi:hypothetical protein
MEFHLTTSPGGTIENEKKAIIERDTTVPDGTLKDILILSRQ